MRPPAECETLEQVRAEIDRIDRTVVGLLAERAGYVRRAAAFKTTAADVKAPQRVEAVIGKVRATAAELGADPDLIEQVYRALIGGFIRQELKDAGH